MIRRGALLRRVTIGSSVGIAGVALWALGLGPIAGLGGDPPGWVDVVLQSVAIGNLATASLAFRRGRTVAVAASCLIVGLGTLAGGWFVGTLSAGRPGGASLVFLTALVGGTGVAGIGIASLELRGLRAAIATRSRVVVVLGLAAVAGELVGGLLSTAIGLLAFLWAAGIGYGLAPLVALGALRWIETAGVRVDDTLGIYVHRETGLEWRFRDVIHVEGTPRPGRVLFIGIAAIGLLLVLLAPDVGPSTRPLLRRCSPAWGELAYSVDWSTMQFEWSDGCRTRSSLVDRAHVVGGGLLLLAGVVGE